MENKEKNSWSTKDTKTLTEDFNLQNSDPSIFSRIPVNKYDFYISRQKYEDTNGQEMEVVAILTMHIAKLTYNNLNFDKIQISFVSVGSIKKKYKIRNNFLEIEMIEKDTNIWQLGLGAKTTYLDINIFDDEYLKIYLFSSNK